MEDPGSQWRLFLLFILLLLSAFFSAAETALTSLSKIRLRNMLDEKVKNAEKINKLMENPNKLLSALLVGNNLVNISISAIATSLAISVFDSAGVGIATGVVTIIILIFGEITPKTLAASNSEKVSLKLVNAVSFIVLIFSPIITVLNFITVSIIKLFGFNSTKQMPLITEAELKTMVNVSHEEGVLEGDEKRMIVNVFEFGEATAKDISTPRTDIVAVNINSTYNEILQIFKSEKFSRLPVYEDSIDNVVGILHLKDFMFPQIKQEDFKLNEYIREPYFTYESKPTVDLFSIMRQKRIGIAIVLDEYGGTSGLLTIEDLVEEIVGELSDEYDEIDDEIKVIKEDEYIVEGSTKIEDVNEMIGTRLTSSDFDSIGGYVIGVLGRFPETGEEIEADGIKFVIEEVDKNRVEKVRLLT